MFSCTEANQLAYGLWEVSSSTQAHEVFLAEKLETGDMTITVLN
jgi:hypothetical protein